MKKGCSILLALFFCALALAARLLLPGPAERLREVFFSDAAFSRVQEVFSPHG